ncbi:N-acyl amino acid synthase of PEP-CTERM/exosortase system [Chitinivorax tropicus]|uniref:N-acyl amino acid synthase of PEP-CTERM/exosortase system n=1 Tax=Chitinivorax tropicus TaxID=714531 RepID=A0A840MM41_9PROT|nr:PEP-CTERM/exosortase system-associated acyltransferase [Chitinivorax tropicus]MBB5017596.1 N-acyl amino acid synthase of PEP-CTERM/exosortase system [Chitinivorax tropicus]
MKPPPMRDTFFSRYFFFGRIDDTPLLSQSFKLRYQVYCLEKRFLSAQHFENGEEFDHYDLDSTHFAAIDQTDELVGTIRIVGQHTHRYPLQEHCEVSLPGLPRSAVEISRLAVSKQYRRRANDDAYGASSDYVMLPPSVREQSVRMRPEIVLGLYRAVFHYCQAQQIEYLLAAMETGLLRLLNRLCMDFVPIGPEVDYYGPVRPFMLNIRDYERVLRATRPDLHEEFFASAEYLTAPQRLQ